MAKRHAPRGPIKAKEPIDPMMGQNPMTARCTATSKQRGEQCKQPAIHGGTVCRFHGGAAPQVIAAAERRLEELKPKAVLTIDRLMDREEYPTVQFQASKAVIDWVDGKARESMDMKVTGDEVLIAALMAGRKRAAESRKA